MNQEFLGNVLGSIFRKALAGVGGVLVGNGWLNADQWETMIAGAVVWLASAIWSIWNKSKAKAGASGLFILVPFLFMLGASASGCAFLQSNKETICDTAKGLAESAEYLCAVLSDSTYTDEEKLTAVRNYNSQAERYKREMSLVEAKAQAKINKELRK